MTTSLNPIKPSTALNGHRPNAMLKPNGRKLSANALTLPKRKWLVYALY